MNPKDFCFKLFNPDKDSLIKKIHLEFNCGVIVKSVNKIDTGTPETNFSVFPNGSQQMDITFNIGSELGADEIQICIEPDYTKPPKIQVVKLILSHGRKPYTYTHDEINSVNDNFFP